MLEESKNRLQLAKKLGVPMDEEVMYSCLDILELGCNPEDLAIIYSELENEVDGSK